MELVYLWVEKYKNIENQGFNFSPGLECTYDKTNNILDIKPKETLENFFGENINVTAIVGENGSGKSSILEIIKYGINSFSNEKNSDIYFALLYNKMNNMFTIKGNFENYKLINGESKKLNKLDKQLLENQITKQNFKIEIPISTKIHNIFLTKSSYYYPDAGDRNQLSEHLANISDEYLYEKFAEDMQSQYKHSLRSFGQIKQLYYDNIFQNGLEAFYSDIIKLPKDWKKPNKVSISFNHSHVYTSFDSLLAKFKKEKGEIKYKDFIKFKDLYTLHNPNGKPHYQINDWQYFFKYLSILNFITGSYQGISGAINGKLIEESIKEIDANDKNNSMDKLIDFYSKIFEIDGDLYEVPKEYFSKVKEAIFTLEKFDNFYHNGEFSIMIENNFNEIINLIQIHKALTVSVAGFLSFRLSPYFSDGHQEFFNLFAKIYMAINTLFDNKKPKENDTILLLLDEADNYLHPNWQKQFLDIFIDFLSKNYNQYNFQLLITSHSPFILSDLPKENVIFLEDGKQKDIDINTFGANIHTLLSHGFFMKEGLMGEFAKEKINQVYRFITEYDTNHIKTKEEAQNIINLIGEPLIKKQLQKLFDETFDKSNLTLDNEIELLEKKLNALKELKK